MMNVLVTGVGGGGHGEQILKALRLAETDYHIVGTDMSPYSKGLMEVDHPCVVPPARDPAYLETILDICRRHEIRAVFHGSEHELLALSRARETLNEAGLVLPVNTRSIIETCSDKVQTSEALAAHGFEVVPFRKVRTPEDLETVETLPVVLKPSVGGGGSAGTVIAQTREELMTFGRSLLAGGAELIAQDYVGTPDSEYTVGVLHDLDGTFLNAIAVKRNITTALSNRLRERNRSGREDLGPDLTISNGISQGEIGPFPEVTEPCVRIAEALGSRGPLNIQCRLVDSNVHIMEINPRFSGTTSLRAMVGFNEPDILVRSNVLGEPITPRFRYRSGVILRGLAETFIDREVAAGFPSFPTRANSGDVL